MLVIPNDQLISAAPWFKDYSPLSVDRQDAALPPASINAFRMDSAGIEQNKPLLIYRT